ADDRMADRLGMSAQLVGAPGDWFERKPGQPRRRFIDNRIIGHRMAGIVVAMPGDTHLFKFFAPLFLTACRPGLVHSLTFRQIERDAALRRLWDAFNERPIDFARLPRAKNFAKIGGDFSRLRDEQNTRSIAIEPGHKHGPVATLVWHRGGHPLDMT